MHALSLPTYALSSLLVLGAVACAPSAPSNPTWEDDIKPLLAANCVRCHREEPQNFAPTLFRFDVCSTTMVNGSQWDGAKERIERIIARGGQGTMPPGPAAPLSDRQVEILQNWADNGAPCSGTGNAAPVFVLLQPLADSVLTGAAGPELVLRYAIEDADADPVEGRLWAVDEHGRWSAIGAELYDGAGALRWPLATVAAGTYELVVELDDGIEVHERSVGRVRLSPAGELAELR
ncbi:c-type cytochrome [Haliangium sp.]|uniref:c-type cytochrome n=1 Tax=Haliangium sp. TaxID=2663208 RepID=UPI003D0A45F0